MPDRQGSPIIVTGKRQPQVTAIMRWSSRRNAKHERSKKRARPGKLIEGVLKMVRAARLECAFHVSFGLHSPTARSASFDESA
jgi:hypothetical protein